jgi:hypothetical protein
MPFARVFFPDQPAAFRAPDKTVILPAPARRGSGALHSAESKDPGDACWQMLFGAFRPKTTMEDKPSSFVSGQDFSRAVKAAHNEGFSPCTSRVFVSRIPALHANPLPLDGCPMFAPAYMGQKSRGEAPSTVCLFICPRPSRAVKQCRIRQPLSMEPRPSPCHPACPGKPWDRSEAERTCPGVPWRDLRSALDFSPSLLSKVN